MYWFKKYLIGFILFLLFSQFSVYAVESGNPAAGIQFWIRLDARILVLPNNDSVIELKTGNIAQKKNTTVYIAECVDTPTDRICSTGTEEGDMVVYQSTDNLKKMKDLYGYQFGGMTDAVKKTPIVNPVKSNSNGEIPIILLKSLMMVNVSRKFYGVNIVTDSREVKSLDELEQLGTGDEGGQQQGMFKIKIPTPTPKPVVLDQGAAPPSGQGCSDTGDDGLKCCSYNKVDGCDPYGRVFDAVSLEPIANAKVTLIKQRTDGNFTLMTPKETVNAIINPWTTKEDGKFVFLVPAGTYQLFVDLPNYTFPFVSSQLNSNYVKAYYELYYGSGYTGKDIIELKIEHRDIPIVPKGEPYHGPVKLLGYIAELDKEKQIYKISGRASHPLTIVEIQGKDMESGKVTRVLSKVTADKWGFFDATVNTNSLKSSETVGTAKLTKVDLTQESLSISRRILNTLFPFIKMIYAQNSFSPKPSIASFPISHIVNYLEGYAYDSKNQPISNAKIDIYLSGSKKPYYTTQADDKGYYLITSQHLPQMNYSITYTGSDGKMNQISQTKFLEQNIKTIISKKIQVNKYITQLSPFKVSAQERKQFGEQNTRNNNYSPIKMIEKNNTAKNNRSMFLLIIFFLLIGSAIGLAFYLKNKKKPFFT